MSDSNYTPLTVHTITNKDKTRKLSTTAKAKDAGIDKVANPKSKKTKQKVTTRLVSSIGTLIALDDKAKIHYADSDATPCARIQFNISEDKWELKFLHDPGMLIFLKSVPTDEEWLIVESIAPTQTACYASPTDNYDE